MAEPDKGTQSSIATGNPGASDIVRIFLDGSHRSHAVLRTAVVGFGTYQPGWRWSLHAGPQTGKKSENHVGYVISGRMMIEDSIGNEAEVAPGCAFEIGPGGDAWVIGDAPCIALDFTPLAG